MFKLTIVTPEKRILIGQDVEEVTVPAFMGELNILPGHAPLITTLETGVMKWKLQGKDSQEIAVISWGYCQVSPEGVNILASIADLPEEIDLDETKQVIADSEKRVMNEFIPESDWDDFQRSWAHARAQMDVASSVAKK